MRQSARQCSRQPVHERHHEVRLDRKYVSRGLHDQGSASLTNIDLHGLVGANGVALDSYGHVAANLGSGGSTLSLLGGGSVHFDTSAIQASVFSFV